MGVAARDWMMDVVAEAQECPSVAHVRALVVRRLVELVPCETVYWASASSGLQDEAHVHTVAGSRYANILSDLALRPERYTHPPAIAILDARGGAATDREMFSRTERERLPLFTRVLKPAGVHTYIGATLSLGGQFIGALCLARHDASARFLPHEVESIASVRPLISLLEATSHPRRGDRCINANTAAAARLTAREREVASCVAAGMQNKEIAARLGSSPNTVRNQIRSIGEKTGMFSRHQIAAWVNGW